jgi:hypothetical protein
VRHLDRFISQDKYLSGRRGQYSERYGALSPWRGKWDMKFMQDYNFKVSGNKTNTIQFSIDVLNIGNFHSDLGSSSSSYKCAANWCL